MNLTAEKFKIMYDSLFVFSKAETGNHYRFHVLYATSRSLGIIRPVGWLRGFMDYLIKPSPPFKENPYPYMSLAYVHYERGRVSAYHARIHKDYQV